MSCLPLPKHTDARAGIPPRAQVTQHWADTPLRIVPLPLWVLPTTLGGAQCASLLSLSPHDGDERIGIGGYLTTHFPHRTTQDSTSSHPYPIHRATQTPLRLALPSQEEASGLAACPHAQPNTPTTSCREQLHLLARVGCATGWGGLLLRAMHDRSRSGRQHERRTGATPHERPAACPSALTAGQRYPVRPLTPPLHGGLGGKYNASAYSSHKQSLICARPEVSVSNPSRWLVYLLE